MTARRVAGGCLRALVFVALSAALWAALVSAVGAAPAADGLALRWEIERNVADPAHADGRSRATLTLTNRGAEAWPAAGWALYFNCQAGIEPEGHDPRVAFEALAGTLYRMRPRAGFGTLAPGQSIALQVLHAEVVAKMDKAPKGPYVVFDSAPAEGQAINAFERVVPTRPEQLSDAAIALTPEAIYRRNEATATLAAETLPPVLPSPRAFERRAGRVHWAVMPVIDAPGALQREAQQATALLAPRLPLAAQATVRGRLRLRIGAVPGPASPEAYTLVVDPAGHGSVTLRGRTPAAIARGLQSLRELMPLPDAAASEGVTLPALRIADAPRFAYRGLLLDVARNFQPKATVLRLLDLMARYKLNTLHLHLADDEGWRLAIDGLPELTEVGAVRGHTLDGADRLPPAYGSGPSVDDPHGSGFYSHADYVEILRHAAALHIEVIPEIEMPGHSRAAVKAMQARSARLAAAGRADAAGFLLSDPEDASVYRSPQFYTDHVMNPGLASTYAFIEQVVAQVASLHRDAGVPLRTLHVGADELPAGAWERSPACARLMQSLGLRSRAELWDHFYRRVIAIVRAHGAQPAGWEELGARRPPGRDAAPLEPNPAFIAERPPLFVWNNLDDAADLAYRLANAGYPIVLAPATALYFDMAHSARPDEPGVNWAATIDLDTVFDYLPLDATRVAPTDPARRPGLQPLSARGRGQVLGLEATLFSETVREPQRIDYLLMPRLLALAECAWAGEPAWARASGHAVATRLHAQAWSVFANQVGQRVLPRLAAEWPDLNYRIAPPGLLKQGGRVWVNHQLPGFSARYTTDGSEPGPGSPLVAGPIGEHGWIRVAAFDRNGRRGLSSLVDNR
ncbi:family 20 glycosylhydrolase [Ideonella sp.]|uniref:family 20 glycosylhydrolase n=1 Tax=Ideonella sp. TaxID=1929293 RepID=UPI002B458F97|nr:family 20 glycosylhydrolase [Ideonella sp.]HJV71405.1 family 20 glycosylhydrolase [Ideonella sp.]